MNVLHERDSHEAEQKYSLWTSAAKAAIETTSFDTALKHCSTQDLGFFGRLLRNLGLSPAGVQPACADSRNLRVELEVHVVEPARQVTDEAILVLNLRVQVTGDVAQFGLRKARLKAFCAVENCGDIALRVEQKARAI